MKTERQAEAQRVFNECGRNYAQAAKRLNTCRKTVQELVAKAEKWDSLDPALAARLSAKGLTDLGSLHSGWLLDKDALGSGESLYFYLGKDEKTQESLVEAIAEAMASVDPPPAVVAPEASPGLCAVFPVADLHIGMLADKEEVGEDWDTKIAGRVFGEAFARIAGVTPSAEVAILAQLGDLLHVDDQRNVTPQSGHQLDVDSRYFVILRRAVAAMKTAIEVLRQRYPQVIYCGRRGNHDLTAHYAVTLALAEHYRDVAGVTIIQDAGEFYVHEFGRNMIVLHHGDRAKPDRLVHFAAAEWPEIWGRTKYRLALSGHVHHESVKEVGGMRFESVGTIIPRDAYAYSNAYSARRGLVSIVLHHDQGEISRARVNL
jgi:hypothetical protein